MIKKNKISIKINVAHIMNDKETGDEAKIQIIGGLFKDATEEAVREELFKRANAEAKD